MKREVTTFWYDRKLRTVDGRLTTDQAIRLLKGGAPTLTHPMNGPQPDPAWWQVGDQAELVPYQLSIEITKLTAKAGNWRASYLIRDYRPKLLGRRTGFTTDPTKAIGATDRHAPGNLRKEPEYAEGIGKTSTDMAHRLRATEELPNEKLRRLERQQLNRLRNARRQAEARGLDTADLDAAIERELMALQERLDALEKAA